jgi:hypothetical protein
VDTNPKPLRKICQGERGQASVRVGQVQAHRRAAAYSWASFIHEGNQQARPEITQQSTSAEAHWLSTDTTQPFFFR